jgi:chromatin remodeling complex protein RSC6
MSAQPTTSATSATSATAVDLTNNVPDSVDEPSNDKKARRVVDAVSVAASFDALLALVEAQITQLRTAASSSSAKSGNTGVKFLRTVASRIKNIKKDSVRVMETPKKRPRAATATNGGFLKPHHVTKEMAEFAEWAPDSLKSRVDITKAICNYVKTKDLYDPLKRKHILPDEKLRNLLQYNPGVSGKDPLTFFYLQKLIGSLQVKDAAPVKA